MFVNNRNMDPKMRDVWFVSVAAARPRAGAGNHRSC